MIRSMYSTHRILSVSTKRFAFRHRHRRPPEPDFQDFAISKSENFRRKYFPYNFFLNGFLQFQNLNMLPIKIPFDLFLWILLGTNTEKLLLGMYILATSPALIDIFHCRTP